MHEEFQILDLHSTEGIDDTETHYSPNFGKKDPLKPKVSSAKKKLETFSKSVERITKEVEILKQKRAILSKIHQAESSKDYDK